MGDIVRPIEVWAVRMQRFDHKENTVFGAMVWPEVLLCPSEEAAHKLCKFLNDASFQDYMDMVYESELEPDMALHKAKWHEKDIAQYTTAHVPDLSQYDELGRVGESMSVLKRLFPTLDSVAALRRRR